MRNRLTENIPEVEQSLYSNSNTSVPSVAAVKAAIRLFNNSYADIVNSSLIRQPYTNITDTISASKAGDTINLYMPIIASTVPSGQAFLDIKPNVNLNVYGVLLRSPDAAHDIITFRGGKSTVNAFNSTITTAANGSNGGWFIGTNTGVEVDVTINDLNLDLPNYDCIGFALYGFGKYVYSGNILSNAKYIIKLASDSNQFTKFIGTGNIVQSGAGNIAEVYSSNIFEWNGNITAKSTSIIYMESGTVILKNGVLYANDRTTGSEQVIVQYSGSNTTVILENYSVFGVNNRTVITATTIILRGSTTIVGDLVGNIIDERPSKFTNIIENQVGIHPAFNSQHELNLYLLSKISAANNSSNNSSTTLGGVLPVVLSS